LSKAPGWVVTVAEPRSTYLATLWPPLATLALGGLGSAAAALFVAMRIGKRVLRPVRALTRWAEAVAAGGGGGGGGDGGDASCAPGEPARVREFAGLQRAVRAAEERLRDKAAAVAAGEAPQRGEELPVLRARDRYGGPVLPRGYAADFEEIEEVPGKHQLHGAVVSRELFEQRRKFIRRFEDVAARVTADVSIREKDDEHVVTQPSRAGR
jgi:hypothetical protein